jgi:very-short-patch-repair endonuclease
MGQVESDRIIASIATGQHAAVSRRQLLDAGVPAHVIKHRVRTGGLITVHPGAYRLPGSRVTWHQRITAATLAAGPGAVASHRAAAFLHGLEGIEPRLEVSVPRGRAPAPSGIVVHRIDLARSDTEVRDGILRTRPPATILGLAAVVPIVALEMALDDGLLRGLVSCDQLQRRLDADSRRGRPGVAALAELLAVRAGAVRWTQSEFERRLLVLIASAGIALPVPQFEVVLPDGSRVFLDFAWPEDRVALEAQSYRHHAGRIAWSRDQTRLAVLASIGWRVVPVTWEDLVGSPGELITTVKRARAA